MTTESIKPLELKTALQNFASSPRFNVLKSLRLGRLLPEECGDMGTLSGLTLGDLVELGNERISGLHRLTLLQEGSLVALLQSLCMEDEVSARTDQEASSSEQNVVRDRSVSSAIEAEMPIGSVQVESRLREWTRKLSTHPAYGSIKGKTLGTFWDPSWARAPFEEALSIQQIVSMDPAVLFKKRMVTDNRVSLLTKALERALYSISGPVSQEAQLAPGDLESWLRGASDLSSMETASLEVLASASADTRYSHLQEIFRGILHAFSASECVEVISGRELTQKLRDRLAVFVANTIDSEVREVLVALLQGPAVRTNYLARVLTRFSRIEGAALELLTIIVARGLGAQPVVLENTAMTKFWTLNAELVDIVLNQARSAGAPSGGASHESSLVDPFLLELNKGQEGRVSKGKRCPPAKKKKVVKGR